MSKDCVAFDIYPQQTFEVWRAMEKLVDGGLVRQLGISNCTRLEQLKAVCEAARIAPAVLQNRFHAENGYDRQLREFCRSRGIVYQGFWTLTANPQLLAHARQDSCPDWLVGAVAGGSPAVVNELADACLIYQDPVTGRYSLAPLVGNFAMAQPAPRSGAVRRWSSFAEFQPRCTGLAVLGTPHAAAGS